MMLSSVLECTIYGIRNSEQAYLKHRIIKELESQAISYIIREVDNVRAFIAKDLRSVPTVQFDNGQSIEKADYHDFKDLVEATIAYISSQKNQQMKTTIVPTDFSDTSRSAFLYACALAQKLGSDISLVHIFHPKAVSVEGVIAAEDSEEERQRRALVDFKKVCTGLSGFSKYEDGLRVESRFYSGYAIEKLVDISREDQTDCMVIGATGLHESAIDRWLGSVSSHVAKHAHCPVFIVPTDHVFSPFKRILYASDSLTLDRIVVQNIRRFATLFDSEVYVCHVSSTPEYYPEQEMKALFKQYIPKERIYSVQLTGDSPTETILNYAEGQDIDLIVLATKQRSFLKRLFHQSATQQAALRAKRPMLVLHSTDDIAGAH